jgi:CO/xanthine dehydrogenase FAD-binding subunit
MRFSSAATLDEALHELAGGARPVAGGSDMVVGARQGKAPLPEALVAIDRLRELTGIEPERGGEGSLRIGALVRHAEIESSPLIAARFTALADGSALVGSPSTRNVGTLGGNVMNGSPAMDTGAPLVVLGAEAELRTTEAARRVPVETLWTGPGRTVAEPGELCVAIHLPDPASTAPWQDASPLRAGSAYVRLEYRRAMEIAVVGAAAWVALAEDGTIRSCRIALAAVAPTIIRAPGAEAAIAGRLPAPQALAAVADAAAEASRPIADLRAGEAYRRHTVGVVARRAVDIAARRAAGEAIPVPANRARGIGAPLGGAA